MRHADAGRRQVRAREIHNRSNGALGYAVELMHVRRARRLRDELGVEDLRKLVGQKLTSVVRVEGAYHSNWRRRFAARQGVQVGDESAHASRSLRLLSKKVDRLETRVVVDQHEGVTESAEERTYKRAHDVGVDEPACVGRLVLAVSVW